MTEEEKEAIENLKSWREYIIKHKEDVNKANDIEFYLRIAINLIEKQEQEIKELKKHFKMATRIIEGYIDEVEKDTLKIKNYRHKNIK